MLPESYEYARSRDFKQFEFYSEGPRGRIRKIISYSYFGTWDGRAHYNLGFGDYDAILEKVSDLLVSDNQDRDKVLSTVAATAVEFTRHIPNCRILIEGSTSARTRLYQMKIAARYNAISEVFDIQCLTKEGRWIPFEKGNNFLAFVIERKT